jgi:hypothetical protein
MTTTAALTRREAALSAVIDWLISHVEELGCTCASGETHDRLHGHPSSGSGCTGVALGVEAGIRRRRALRLTKEDEKLVLQVAASLMLAKTYVAETSIREAIEVFLNSFNPRNKFAAAKIINRERGPHVQ